MHSFFERYFGQPSTIIPRGLLNHGRGIFGTPPSRFPLKENFVVSLTVDLGHTGTCSCARSVMAVGRGFQQTCPRFDGTDFRGLWSKLE